MPILTRHHTMKLPLPLMSLAAGLNVQLMTHTGEEKALRQRVVCHYITNRWVLSMDVTKPGFVEEAFDLLVNLVAPAPVEQRVPAPERHPDPDSFTDFADGIGLVLGSLLYRQN